VAQVVMQHYELETGAALMRPCVFDACQLQNPKHPREGVEQTCFLNLIQKMSG
jgi:hypothetical protein